jgi:hypothetical protein
MTGDFGHQDVAEQHHILLLFLGFGETPETPNTEMRDVVDVDGGIDNSLQP